MAYKEGDILENDQGQRVQLQNGAWVPLGPDVQPSDGGSFFSGMLDPSAWARGAGLTARNALEGVGGMMDFAGTPIRAAMQYMGAGDPAGGGGAIADLMGLPKPQGTVENIVSEGEKVLAGGSGLLSAAQRGPQLLNALTLKPGSQMASMVGAGVGAGSAKEAGMGPWGQLGAAIVGGLAAPASVSAGNKAVNLGQDTIRAMARSKDALTNIEKMVAQSLKARGIDASKVSQSVKKQIAKDMQGFMETGDVSPEIMSRLIDYRVTGATPTAGAVTLDPGIITRQKNLAKLGANSSDPKLQRLSQIANENVKKLTEQLNRMGADTADDAYTSGVKVTSTLDDIAARQKGKIDPLFEQARNTSGRSAQMNPHAFTQRAGDLLDEKLLNSKLPSDVRNVVNSIAKGETPLTVDVAEQLKTRLFQLGKATSDKQERMALGLVRQALEETPLLDDQGQNAINAFNAARAANRQWRNVVDKTPALKAIIDDGVEPDKFMQDFIIGNNKKATVASVRNLMGTLKNDPGARSVIKNYVARYLKKKALGGAEDEIGNFSQSAYNRAIDSIGDQKLKAIFPKDEYAMLKAVGRVGGYEQAQPVGSAVNNSNTASSAMSQMLDWLGSVQVLRRVPFGSVVSDQARSISQNMEASKLTQIPKLAKPPAPIGVGPLIAPAIGPQE